MNQELGTHEELLKQTQSGNPVIFRPVLLSTGQSDSCPSGCLIALVAVGVMISVEIHGAVSHVEKQNIINSDRQNALECQLLKRCS